ncbi:MAG TPA: DUF4173 domain-containing protein [Candidatus Hydrogenedentes bacterium]|nr:DUF4173 domain-containing protein [Candidatus Hydrogenedentota bacterium]HPG70236.1 DUF4173 domain-containing protein [Candidatus Hydrogenedentota bacterium]
MALLDYLIYQGAGGLSYSIAFIALSVVAAAFACRDVRLTPLAFFGVVLALVAFRCAWQCGNLVVSAGVILLIALPIASRLGRTKLPELLPSFALTCVMGMATWYFDLTGRRGNSRREGGRKWSQIPAAVVAVPLLVCAAFAIVFILSNPIVQEMSAHWSKVFVDKLVELVELYAPNPARTVFWIGCILFVNLLLRPAVHRVSAPAEGQNDTVVARGETANLALHYRVAVNTLIAVNILFLLYNAVDAYHLVIRDALPPGLNHSQYAHRGAFWLTVALAMTTFVVGCIFYGNLNFHPKRRALMRWTALWLAQNYLLAAWVFMRIHMYVVYNGMTRMRVVALVGTSLVVIGLVLVTVKAARRRSLAWLVRKEVGAFLLACILLAVIPMDYLSWRYNTSNILTSNPPRTSVQLTRQPLSPEGLATLTPLLSHPDPVIAEGAAALLGRWYFGDGQRYADGSVHLKRWTQYQMGHAWCAHVLGGCEDEILGLVPNRDWDSKLEALRRHTARWI